MKALLLAIAALTLCACATSGTQPRAGAIRAADTGTELLALLPGVYDNHAQVWQARQRGAQLVPVHMRQRIVAADGGDNVWLWHLTMPDAEDASRAVTWRYVARTLKDGSLMLTPYRPLPPSAPDAEPRWAKLSPCALRGGLQHGRLELEANQGACNAIIAGLGDAAALLPLFLGFDGNTLIVQTYSDVARGETAHQVARRVRWYQAWVAINGAGPDAGSDDSDWHMQRDVRIGNQGRSVPVRWRDGAASGYSLKLEVRDYRQRDLRVLQLSLVRDADGATIAYVWADPDSRHIGLNLGWLQAGLTRGQGSQPAAP